MTSVKKILLHIGMAKSGSTALQHAFRRQADELRAAGVLYPEVSSSSVSHKFLAFRLRDDDELPGHFRNIHGNDPARREQCFRDDWQAIRDQVDKHQPHTLLLSTEHLFYGFDRGRGAALRDVLAEISSDIEVVAYLRQPSAYYLSDTQQTLKGTSEFPAPAPVQYRNVLTQCQALFSRVTAIPFDRKQLRDGDVVADFFGRFLPDFRYQPQTQARPVNETLSAESMALLQDYLHVIHPGRARLKTRDNRRLISYILLAEQQYGLFSRPTLRPEVAEYLDHASTDLLWLREQFGIEFSGLDYRRIAERDNPWADARRVGDICQLDSARQTALQMRILAALLSPRIPLPFGMLVWLLSIRQPTLARLARKFLALNPPQQLP